MQFIILIQYVKDLKTQNLMIKDIFNDTLSLLSPFTQLFVVNDDSKIFYFDIPKAQYFGSFPASITFKNYSLYTRPCYINHMTQSQIYPNSSYFYQPILISARDNLPYSALTYSLRDNDSMFGIALQLLPILDNNIYNIPLNILLVYQNSDVILSIMETFHQLTGLVRITISSYTGFNETDWQTIQQNSMINQNRDVIFYLMNKIYKKSVFVYAYLF